MQSDFITFAGVFFTRNLLKTIFSQAFLKAFAEITCGFSLYGIEKIY